MISSAETLISENTSDLNHPTLIGKPIRIVIFAKAPVPGFTKTRLIPALGDDGAAELSKLLLQYTVNQALAAGIGVVELCVTPAKEHPIWQTVELPANIEWSCQQGGDLGNRLSGAAQRVVGNGEAMLLTGTDCPELSAERIRASAIALKSYDTSLIPAVDGGYVLLGLKRFIPSIFTNIPWSTSSVVKLTRGRILENGYTVKELPVLHDIDEPQDLRFLPTELKP